MGKHVLKLWKTSIPISIEPVILGYLGKTCTMLSPPSPCLSTKDPPKIPCYPLVAGGSCCHAHPLLASSSSASSHLLSRICARAPGQWVLQFVSSATPSLRAAAHGPIPR